VVQVWGFLPIADFTVDNPFDVGYVAECLSREVGLGDLTKARTGSLTITRSIQTDVLIASKLISFCSQMLLSSPVAKYTMQSPGGEELAFVFAKRNDTGIPQSVRNRDILIRHTLGPTHNYGGRELAQNAKKLTVRLAPANFIINSRVLDVLPSMQETNKSASYAGIEATACCDTELREDVEICTRSGWVYTGYKILRAQPCVPHRNWKIPVSHCRQSFILASVISKLKVTTSSVEAPGDFCGVCGGTKRLRTRFCWGNLRCEFLALQRTQFPVNLASIVLIV
jgi:hypothetical protein